MRSTMIYMVRHGQTDENNDGIIQGQLNTCLNEVGIDQAKRVAKALKDIRFDLIYTSDLKRAHDTAYHIAKYHENVPMHVTQVLRERCMGDLQGKHFKEARDAASEETCESIQAFSKRISDFWNDILIPELASRKSREIHCNRAMNIAVVSHGAFISSMTRYLVQVRRIKDERPEPHGGVSTIRFCPNASLTLFELQDDTEKLVKFGDTSYLDASVITFGNSDELCLRNLSSYHAPKLHAHLPRSRRAAVLVALFVGREGDLYVILSRRSDSLRSYPGDTSLPGGKTETSDHSLENAARREAFEEIGLPLDKNKIPFLCSLEPFLSSNDLLVTPIVVLILDKSLKPFLNIREVSSIFSHPLYGFLTISPIREPEPVETGGESPSHEAHPQETNIFQETQKADPSKYYYTFRDIIWHSQPVRIHTFHTGRELQSVKPITGLTAAILIRVAQIGYGHEPAFELYAPGQSSLEDRIAAALFESEKFRTACKTENIDMIPWKMRLKSERGRL